MVYYLVIPVESYQQFVADGQRHEAPQKEKHNKAQPYHDETLRKNAYLSQLDPLPTHLLWQLSTELKIADSASLSYICKRKLVFASREQSRSYI